MKNSTEQFFVIIPPGFEQICAQELSALIAQPLTLCHGGLSFQGNLRDLYLANLWLRCASRVLVRLDHFKCRDFPTLYRKALRLPWGRFIKPGQAVKLRVTCHASRLNHSVRVAQTLEEAIQKVLGNQTIDENQPAQTIFARLDEDQCSLSIDSSGELLHRRGYRIKATPAPLRETLAAGCLLQCSWDGERALCDPFCGSGTFAIEGALIAARIPPGRQRDFAFMHWPGFRHGLWQTLLDAADRQRAEIRCAITASDISEQALVAARHNAQLAGVDDAIAFCCQPAQQASPTTTTGLMICNPPYGERLNSSDSVRHQLHQLQKTMRQHWPLWDAAMLLPRDSALSDYARLCFSNGGIDVCLYAPNRIQPT